MKALKNILGLVLYAVLIFTSACAGAKVRPSPEASNVISGMVVTEGAASTSILFKGSRAPSFNPFKMTDPLRIVIDIANSDVTRLKSSTSVDNGTINDIKATQMGEETGFIGRIEIGLERSLKYTATAVGNDIKVEVSKTESAPEAPPPPLEGGVEAPSEALPVPEGGAVAGAEEVLPPAEGEEAIVEAPPPGEELPPVAEAEPPPETAAPPGEELPPVEGEALPPEAAAPPPVAEAPPPAEEFMVEEAPPPPAPVAEAPPPPPAQEAPEEAPMVEEEAPSPVVAMVPPPPPAEAPRGKIRVEKGKIKLPKPVIFGSNVAQTTPEGEALLREVAEFLMENPAMRVRIDGYSDNIGDNDFNQAVSEYRAIWAKLLLTSMGITEGRLQVRGFGSSKPVASNKTEVGRARNRRVEFTVLIQ